MKPPILLASRQTDSANEFVGAQIHLLISGVEPVKGPPSCAARGNQFDFGIVHEQGGRRVSGRGSVRDISADRSAVLGRDRGRFWRGPDDERALARPRVLVA